MRNNRTILFGACAKLSKSTGIDAIFWRILFIIWGLVNFPTALIVYIILRYKKYRNV